MEVFAGFMTHTDHHLGRLFSFLEERGIAEDTIVMVLSDNGASAEGGVTGTMNEAAGWLGQTEPVEDAVARTAEIGGHDAYNHYPFGWAWAGNTPHRLWKWHAWLGGVRTPRRPLGCPDPPTPGSESSSATRSTSSAPCSTPRASLLPRRSTGSPSSRSTGLRCSSFDDAAAGEHRSRCSTSR